MKIRVSVVRFRPWPPIFQKPTVLGWFFFARLPHYWRGFRGWPRERYPSEPYVFTLANASLFSVFSGGLASVREVTSFICAGLEAVGCARRLLEQGRLNFTTVARLLLLLRLDWRGLEQNHRRELEQARGVGERAVQPKVDLVHLDGYD